MNFESPFPQAAAPRPSADICTAPDNIALPPFTSAPPDSNIVYLIIGALIAGLAALAVMVFIDAGVLLGSDRTRLDLPASICPAPAAGQQLVVTVAPNGLDDFTTHCRLIGGRSA